MFELGTTDHWWEIAKRYPVLSNHPNILKPLGYAHIVNLIETFKPKRILEVGHGSGTFLFQMFKNNPDIEIWGLDDEVKDSSVSIEDLKKIKEWNPHVKFVSGLLGTNVKELPDDYFDLVYSVSVIEHIPHEHLDSVFAETLRILKPGGMVSHTYDIYYEQDTKAVYNAYEKSGLKWLRPKDTMNVFWEDWLDKMDFEALKSLCEKIIFENPVFVAEHYMWQQERNNRQAPINCLTVLTAATKPSDDANLNFEQNSYKEKKKSDEILLPENFNYFTHSQKDHFDIFEDLGYTEELIKNDLDQENCDIKTYQDLMIYSFLKKNIPPGSKILEIGGNGYSRILSMIKKDYEVWNIDKIEEKDISGKDFSGIKFVNDSIGNLSKVLPDNYFDFVYSVSGFKYDDVNDKARYELILKDINRVLKQGGYSLHCAIALIKGSAIFLPQVVKYFFENEKTLNQFIPQLKIIINPELYYMSEKYYAENWQPYTNKSYRKFGKPISYNILWGKTS